MKARGSGGAAGLPPELAAVLPRDTALAWATLAGQLPRELYLGGGTAVSVRLGHRESRDLDFFFDEPVNLLELRDRFVELGPFAVTEESAGTLKGLFGATKVEVFDASGLVRLAPPETIAGLEVASLQDLMAMKLKVMAERGEMRDYFDVKSIDELGGVSVEEGVRLYMKRYQVDVSDAAVPHLYRAMGDLSDVEVDELVPNTRAALQRWWSVRQVQALRNADRFG